MNKIFRWSFVVAVFLPVVATGQSTAPVPPKPSPPFLAPIPDQSACKIIISSLGKTDEPPPGRRSINQLVMTKSGINRQLLFSYTDGSRSEIWFSRAYRIERIPPHQEILITPLPQGGDAGNTDFPHLSWLNLANYVGVESKNGQSCWHFKTKIKLSERETFIDYSAYVGIKTKLPVDWDFGPTHYEFASISPATLPAMPPDLAAALKSYLNAAALPNAYLKH